MIATTIEDPDQMCQGQQLYTFFFELPHILRLERVHISFSFSVTHRSFEQDVDFVHGNRRLKYWRIR